MEARIKQETIAQPSYFFFTYACLCVCVCGGRGCFCPGTCWGQHCQGHSSTAHEVRYTCVGANARHIDAVGQLVCHTPWMSEQPRPSSYFSAATLCMCITNCLMFNHPFTCLDCCRPWLTSGGATWFPPSCCLMPTPLTPLQSAQWSRHIHQGLSDTAAAAWFHPLHQYSCDYRRASNICAQTAGLAVGCICEPLNTSCAQH